MSGQRAWTVLRRSVVAVALAVLASAATVWAHESRPAYLEINETAPGRYAVLWRTPLLSGRRLPVALNFPDGARNVTEPTMRTQIVEHKRG